MYASLDEIDRQIEFLQQLRAALEKDEPVKAVSSWIASRAAMTAMSITQPWHLAYLVEDQKVLRRREKGKGYEYHPEDVKALAAMREKGKLFLPKQRPFKKVA